MTHPADEPLRHGYTMRDLDLLARKADTRAYTKALDPGDRYDTAWHAITEHLYTVAKPPTVHDLIYTGATAINRAAQDHRQTWGMTRTWGAEEGTRGGFQRYWQLARVAPSPEGRIVDEQALRQIWPLLSPTHRAVLTALAAHGSQTDAATATGKSYATFGSHLKMARRAFYALWHEHETPSRMWGKNDHRQGRRTATQTLRNRHQQRARRATA